MKVKSVHSATPSQSETQRPRVLFVHNHRTRFVQIDLELLQRHFEVLEWYQQSRFVHIIGLTKAILSSDVVFGWFASWHTLFPLLIARIFRRPTILVVGGYDTAKLPHIGYGNFGNPWKKWVSLVPIRLANILIVNSNYIRHEVLSNAGADPNQIRVVSHGFAAEPHVSPEHPKENLVITVGNVSRENLHRKGHEPFVRSATWLPDTNFVLIGLWVDDAIDYLRQIAPPNVSFSGWVSDDQLKDYYDRASVYVQASLHEGFGMALAEAMLHGCIPVVSTAGALPEVVGGDALVVSSLAEKPLADAIRTALSSSPAIRRKVRERIVNNFSLDERCRLLRKTILESIDGSY